MSRFAIRHFARPIQLSSSSSPNLTSYGKPAHMANGYILKRPMANRLTWRNDYGDLAYGERLCYPNYVSKTNAVTQCHKQKQWRRVISHISIYIKWSTTFAVAFDQEGYTTGSAGFPSRRPGFDSRLWFLLKKSKTIQYALKNDHESKGKHTKKMLNVCGNWKQKEPQTKGTSPGSKMKVN